MRIQFENINPNKLHDELILAGIVPESLESDLFEGNHIAENVWITVSDEITVETLQQVIDNHDSTPVPQPPTEIEILQQKNVLLEAQNKALRDVTDFHEELIVELAMMVYQ